MKSNKVAFLYDGFNFYNGLKDAGWKKYYWLDIVKFSQRVVGKYKDWTVNQVYYYTALPIDKNKAIRQKAFIDVNKSSNPACFQVVFGKYKNRSINCTNCHTLIPRWEEKQTDVNIAIGLIDQCRSGNTDVICLVSGDNDLKPALKYIQEEFQNIRVLVFYPPHRNHSELQVYAWDTKHLLSYESVFRSCLFEKITTIGNTHHTIPPTWELEYPI